MSTYNELYYLTRQEIDDDKWDHCIRNAENGLIYAYTFYLDAMCTNWSAVVLNDYEAVMPLPWRKKWGIRYIFSPPFLPQSGVIGKFANYDYEAALKLVREYFLYGDIFFNEQNHLPNDLIIKKKTNYILPLQQPYEKLAQNFTTILRKNLRSAGNKTLQLKRSNDYKLIIKRFQSSYQSKIESLSTLQYEQFSTLCIELAKRNMIMARTVEDSRSEIIAGGIFLKDEKRIYNVINATTANGRKMSANHFLLASVINEFSETDLVFDFEGSDLPGVKEFYLGFRPEHRPYFHYHFNHLPFPLKLFKR